MMEPDAAPGTAPGALRPPARSSLTVIGSAGGAQSPARQESEPKAQPGAEGERR
jgi:hypothetical protein